MTTSAWIKSCSLCARRFPLCVLWTTLSNFELRKSVGLHFRVFFPSQVQYECVAEQKCHNQMLQIMRTLCKRDSIRIYIYIFIYNISYRSCIGWSEWLFRWIRCRNWRCPDQIEQWVAQDATLDQAWISTKRGLADLLILPTCDILWYHDAMLMQHSFRHWSERAGGWCDSS